MNTGVGRKPKNWLLAVMLAFALAGCTHAPAKIKAGDEAVDPADADPLEKMNRAVYRFNYTVDQLLLKPVSTGYRYVMPKQGQRMVSNFLDNLYTPVVFGNSVLQRDPQNSFATFWRFMLNSTVGIGGLFDVASEAGLKSRPADFGETLAMYGMGSGPYIMLPVIGPCNARDTVGRVADAFMNPFNYAGDTVSYSMWGATAIDTRSRNAKLIDDIYSSSLDPYSTFRSGFIQKRRSDINRAIVSREKALERMGSK